MKRFSMLLLAMVFLVIGRVFALPGGEIRINGMVVEGSDVEVEKVEELTVSVWGDENFSGSCFMGILFQGLSENEDGFWYYFDETAGKWQATDTWRKIPALPYDPERGMAFHFTGEALPALLGNVKIFIACSPERVERAGDAEVTELVSQAGLRVGDPSTLRTLKAALKVGFEAGFEACMKRFRSDKKRRLPEIPLP